MAKYMVRASYSVEGAQGLRKEGGSARRAAVQKMVEGLGGKMECFYFSFGEADAFAIIDVPDPVSAVAMSLAVNSAIGAHLSTSVLITPEEMDQAAKKSVSYRPPGG